MIIRTTVIAKNVVKIGGLKRPGPQPLFFALTLPNCKMTTKMRRSPIRSVALSSSPGSEIPVANQMENPLKYVRTGNKRRFILDFISFLTEFHTPAQFLRPDCDH